LLKPKFQLVQVGNGDAAVSQPIIKMPTNISGKFSAIRSLASLTEYHLANFVSQPFRFSRIGAFAILANFPREVLALLLLGFEAVAQQPG
jgi:hypothetical protein